MTKPQRVETDSLLVEKKDGIAWITVNRPKVRNAMNDEVMLALGHALVALNTDASCRVVVIRGAGAHFSAGGDLTVASKVLEQSRAERTATIRRTVDQTSAFISRAIFALRKPLIVSVRGHAIGLAFHLAVAADLVLASTTARFSFPYVKLGHTMDHGESFYLPRKVGMARAMELMLTGKTITAEEAERMNIINWVVADEELDARTDQLAREIAGNPAMAVVGAKALLRDAPGATLDAALAAEAVSVGACAGSDDFEEAIVAFFEKRPPRFGSKA